MFSPFGWINPELDANVAMESPGPDLEALMRPGARQQAVSDLDDDAFLATERHETYDWHGDIDKILAASHTKNNK